MHHHLVNCRPRHGSRIAQGPARARLHSSQVRQIVYHFDARASRLRTATLLSKFFNGRGTSARSGFGRELPQLGEPTTRMTRSRHSAKCSPRRHGRSGMVMHFAFRQLKKNFNVVRLIRSAA